MGWIRDIALTGGTFWTGTALVVALAATQSGQTLLGLFGARLDDLYSWIRTLLGLTR